MRLCSQASFCYDTSAKEYSVKLTFFVKKPAALILASQEARLVGIPSVMVLSPTNCTNSSICTVPETGALPSTALSVCSANLLLLSRFIAPRRTQTSTLALAWNTRRAILCAWPPHSHALCPCIFGFNRFSPGTGRSRHYV